MTASPSSNATPPCQFNGSTSHDSARNDGSQRHDGVPRGGEGTMTPVEGRRSQTYDFSTALGDRPLGLQDLMRPLLPPRMNMAPHQERRRVPVEQVLNIIDQALAIRSEDSTELFFDN